MNRGIIANMIIEGRLRKGLSQHDLAQLIKKSDGLIAKIELGKLPITKENALRIAEVLEFNADDFVKLTLVDKLKREHQLACEKIEDEYSDSPSILALYGRIQKLCFNILDTIV